MKKLFLILLLLLNFTTFAVSQPPPPPPQPIPIDGGLGFLIAGGLTLAIRKIFHLNKNKDL